MWCRASAIHNIRTDGGRADAIREAYRILRLGGRILIADLPKIREYGPVRRALGAHVGGPSSIGWRMWWSGPWMPTRLIRAGKPA